MKYISGLHHRRCIRLKGYDYSKAGFYFITICVKDRKCLFGEIVKDKIELNMAGIMVKNEWINITTVGDIVGAFQSIVTVEYIHGVKNHGWVSFDGKLWQRNYYEHIIRNEKSYQRISDYIVNNPSNWDEDKFFHID